MFPFTPSHRDGSLKMRRSSKYSLEYRWVCGISDDAPTVYSDPCTNNDPHDTGHCFWKLFVAQPSLVEALDG